MEKLIVNTMISKIIVKAIPSINSPRVVSKAIEVVKTLVNPLRFPPSMRATPNSAIARLKLAAIANKTPPIDSLNTAIEASVSDAPKVFAKSLISGSTDSTVLVTKLIIIGVTRTACPRIIAIGVYRRWKNPRGPDLEKIKYSINPRATVGIPSMALKKLTTNDLP